MWLRAEAGVHAETLLTAVGALTGFAAQHAALLRGATVTSKSGFVPKNSVVVAGSNSGQQFLFGDWINLHLFPEQGNRLSLFSFVAGAALKAGVDKKNLPGCAEIAAHVARAVGTANFGIVRAPERNQPHLPPLELVKRLWIPVTKLLQLPAPEQMHVSEPPLSQLHWPVILSIVASQFITATKDTLSPVTGSALVMEAAVITWKISPEAIQPGSWRLAFKDGQVAITQLMT